MKRGTDTPGANDTEFYTVIGPITLLKASVGTGNVTELATENIPSLKHEETLEVSHRKKIQITKDSEQGTTFESWRLHVILPFEYSSYLGTVLT